MGVKADILCPFCNGRFLFLASTLDKGVGNLRLIGHRAGAR